MKLVDTEKPNPSRFAQTFDGKIDFDAYKGLIATYHAGDLDFEVTILDSRQRFGHLDLLIAPVAGAGERWTEFKNVAIHNDPALRPIAVVETPQITPVVVQPLTEEQPAGTHWTEVAPQVSPVFDTQEVDGDPSAGIEGIVAALLSNDSPHVK